MTIIQWYPGHMNKAKKNMEQDIKMVDLSVLVLDARIPFSSFNPEFEKILNQKPQVVVLNKADLADPAVTKQWLAYYKSKGFGAVALNAQKKQGVQDLLKQILRLAEPVMLALEAKGRNRRPVRALVAGAPNTGKSTLINSLMPKATSKTGNKPGVTRGKQWVRIHDRIELLDTPGILWPKFENRAVAFALAVTGAISNTVYDNYQVAEELVAWLQKNHMEALNNRYGIKADGLSPAEVLTEIGRVRGFLGPGGSIRTEDVANLFLAEFRNGKIGRFTLDFPKAKIE